MATSLLTKKGLPNPLKNYSPNRLLKKSLFGKLWKMPVFAGKLFTIIF